MGEWLNLSASLLVYIVVLTYLFYDTPSGPLARRVVAGAGFAFALVCLCYGLRVFGDMLHLHLLSHDVPLIKLISVMSCAYGKHLYLEVVSIV